MTSQKKFKEQDGLREPLGIHKLSGMKRERIEIPRYHIGATPLVILADGIDLVVNVLPKGVTTIDIMYCDVLVGSVKFDRHFVKDEYLTSVIKDCKERYDAKIKVSVKELVEEFGEDYSLLVPMYMQERFNG